MWRCALALAGTGMVLTAVDLAHKAAAGPQQLHMRSGGYVPVVLVLAAAWAGAILLTGSTGMALGGGILVGGAMGNVTSLVFWPGVPNPIVVGTIAFNLADVFVLAGFVLVAATALAFARANPARLREPLRLR
jgi:lipoprotein signal peptidase